MPYSYTQLSGTGSNTNFNFSFGYLSKSHIHAKVDGVEVSYTWLTDFSIQITPAPAAGTVVEVRRITPLDQPAVVWTDGSTLTEADMNLDTRFNLYCNQESKDYADGTVQLDSSGAWDGRNRSTTNFADPTGPTSLVTKKYFDTVYTPLLDGKVAAAAASAAAASGSASAAVSSAINSEDSADDSQAALDEFLKRFMGARPSAPTTRYDGSPLQVGGLYFDTSINQMRVWAVGGYWKEAAPTIAGVMEGTFSSPIVATAGQTVVPVLTGYDTPYILVWLNGAQVEQPEINISDGSNIVFSAPLSAGDEVTYRAFGSFQVADAVPRDQFARSTISFPTRAAAGAVILTLLEGQRVEVDADETHGGESTKYKVQSGALVFVDYVQKFEFAAATYAQLLAYAGRQTSVQVVGDGIAGSFVYNSALANTTDGGTRFAHSSGVGAWQRNFVGAIRPEWFGAKGVPGTDDYPAIKAAIASLPATGGTVLLSKFYDVSKGVLIPPRVIVDGIGVESCGLRKTTNSWEVVTPRRWQSTTYNFNVDFIAAYDMDVDPAGNLDGNQVKGHGFKNASLIGPNVVKSTYGLLSLVAYDTEMKNVMVKGAVTGIYSHDGWLWRAKSVTVQQATTAFKTLLGTSYILENVYARKCNTGFDLTNSTYSTLTSCAVDFSTKAAYSFTGCYGVSVNGSGCESATGTIIAVVGGGRVDFSGFRSMVTTFSSTYAPFVFQGAEVTFNACHHNGISGTGKVMSLNASHVSMRSSFVDRFDNGAGVDFGTRSTVSVENLGSSYDLLGAAGMYYHGKFIGNGRFSVLETYNPPGAYDSILTNGDRWERDAPPAGVPCKWVLVAGSWKVLESVPA